MRLQGKRIIVTGGGSGFGAGMGRRLAAAGARVLLADLNEEAGRAVASSIGEAAVACRVDVANGASYQAMVDRALEALGDLDTVVNNAGYTHRNQPLLDTDELTFDRVYAVNVKSIFHCMRSCVPVFRRRGGGVVLNIGSHPRLRPPPRPPPEKRPR